MIGLPQIAALHEMRQVTHRRDEPIGESAHVPRVGAFGGVGHGLRVGVIQRERFLAENMFAVRDGVQRDLRVGEIRRGDDDSVDVFALHDVLVTRGGDRDAGLLPGAFERGGVGIAKRGDFHVRTQGEPRQMILQRDAAATDDGDIDDVR